MSVWKSPVFYFGILLLVVVTALLAAPYIVNWNGYKQSLETYGYRLTGRQVQIGGDVQIALFPWPKLTAENVAIGNPAGIDGPALLHTDVVTLSLQLGGLLNGNLNVDSVELVEPKVTLIRNADGAVNWLLNPDEDLRRSSLLSNVRLDQIQLSNGSFTIVDRKQGFTTNLSTMDATMSEAPVLEISKDSMRSGGAESPAILARDSRILLLRSASEVTRSTSSRALRQAIFKRSARSPRWGTRSVTRWPARWERTVIKDS